MRKSRRNPCHGRSDGRLGGLASSRNRTAAHPEERTRDLGARKRTQVVEGAVIYCSEPVERTRSRKPLAWNDRFDNLWTVAR